jgi:hypothetical protein
MLARGGYVISPLFPLAFALPILGATKALNKLCWQL